MKLKTIDAREALGGIIDGDKRIELSEYPKDSLEFEAPDGFLYDAFLETEEGLILHVRLNRYCKKCLRPLKHVASSSYGIAYLKCLCSSWQGECSHLSGSFHGGKLTRSLLSADDLDRRKKEEKEKVDEKYAAIMDGDGVKK